MVHSIKWDLHMCQITTVWHWLLPYAASWLNTHRTQLICGSACSMTHITLIQKLFYDSMPFNWNFTKAYLWGSGMPPSIIPIFPPSQRYIHDLLRHGHNFSRFLLFLKYSPIQWWLHIFFLTHPVLHIVQHILWWTLEFQFDFCISFSKFLERFKKAHISLINHGKFYSSQVFCLEV